MSNYAVELTAEESVLLSQIEFDTSKLTHEIYVRQAPLILRLLESLDQRKAVPDIRLKYFTDPRFHHGRIKDSKKGLFERNKNVGDEIYTHPSFLQYLRYFLFGADLPGPVIEAFEQHVGEARWMSSGDVPAAAKRTRALIREFSLDRASTPEEFYRLSLDMGMNETYAHAVFRAAKQVR